MVDLLAALTGLPTWWASVVLAAVYAEVVLIGRLARAWRAER